MSFFIFIITTNSIKRDKNNKINTFTVDIQPINVTFNILQEFRL